MSFKHIPQMDVHGKVRDLGKLPIQNEILFVMDSVGEREKRLAKTPNCDRIGKHVAAHSHSFYTVPSVHAMFHGAVPQPESGCYWPYGRYSNLGEHNIVPKSLAKKGYNVYLCSGNMLIDYHPQFYSDCIVADCSYFFDHGIVKRFDGMASHKLVKWFLTNFKEPFYVFFIVTETHTPYMNKDRKNLTQITAIEYVDKAIGKLIDGIKKLNTKHKTRIIITSDHAEAWDKNATVNHGHNPTHLHKFIKMNKMNRLTRVFMVKGMI